MVKLEALMVYSYWRIYVAKIRVRRVNLNTCTGGLRFQRSVLSVVVLLDHAYRQWLLQA